jgi:hypothetical protein
MRRNAASRFGVFNPRALLPFAFCSIGLSLAVLSFADGTIDQTLGRLSLRLTVVVARNSTSSMP